MAFDSDDSATTEGYKTKARDRFLDLLCDYLQGGKEGLVSRSIYLEMYGQLEIYPGQAIREWQALRSASGTVGYTTKEECRAALERLLG